MPQASESFGHDDAWLKTLPGGGRIYIDRPLPFLVLNRRSSDDTLGLAHRIATISPSSMVWTAREDADVDAIDTLRGILTRQRAKARPFLMVMLYDLPFDPALDEASPTLDPFRFVLGATADEPAQAAARCLSGALQKIHIDLRKPRTESVEHAVSDPVLDPILNEAEWLSRLSLGLPQIHRVRGEREHIYPQIRDELEAAVFDAVLEACATFVHETTPGTPRHYRAYGRSRLVEAALEIDGELDQISRSFDFLLSVSPINTNDAFEEFLAGKCAKAPNFHYRPLTVSLEDTKRRLYTLDVHAAEDPVLETLFLEKRRELDLQLLMLQNRNTPDFRYTSLLQYGPVEPGLLKLANEILEQVAPGSQPARDETTIDCHAVEAAAKAVIARYRKTAPGFDATVHLRADIGMGLMVSGCQLFISTATRMARGRLDALLQHEVGVHVLTAVNGGHQPLGIFGAGLAKYEGIQEGLGVLAEFLVGGLTDARLRLLAARVLVVEAMLSGAGLVECYAILVDRYAFSARAAFNIVSRIFRCGGFTKDAIYLRGLQQIFSVIAQGRDLTPFWLGKIAEHHVSMIDELQQRGLLRAPLATPEFLSRPFAQRQLDRIRAGTSLIDLVLESPAC